MAAYDLLSFDGTAIGTGTDFNAGLDARDRYVVTGKVDVITRRSASPLVVGSRIDPRLLTVRVSKAAGSALSDAAFRSAITELFDTGKNGAERQLVMVGDDGVTNVQLGCLVMGREYQTPVDRYVVSLYASNPVWQATNLTTSAANPASVTNNGTTDALPSLAVTTTNHATLRRCTVKGIAGGGGAVAQITKFALDDANAVANKIYAFINGKSVALDANGAGGASSYVFVAVDTHGDGVTETLVDILYGSALPNNPLYNTLGLGGTGSVRSSLTNAQLAWGLNDWNCSQYPTRPGQWKPGRFGTAYARDSGSPSASGGSAYTDGANDAVVTLRVGQAPQYSPNNANAIILDVGLKGTTLSNFRRVIAGFDALLNNAALAFVRYRKANSEFWIDAWTSTADGTVSTAITVTDSVQIAAGAEYTGNAPGVTLGTGTLTMDGSSTVTLSVPTANQLTVVVGSALTIDYLSGTITIGDETLTLGLAVSDGTTTIDTAERSIESSVANAWLMHLVAPVWSDRDRWFTLPAGATSVSHTLTSGSMVVRHRDAFS